MATEPVTYILVCYKADPRQGEIGDMVKAAGYPGDRLFGYIWYGIDNTWVHHNEYWRVATPLEEDLFYMGHTKLIPPTL